MFATASQYFVQNVQTLYAPGLHQMVTGKVVRHGINAYTAHAPAAYSRPSRLSNPSSTR